MEESTNKDRLTKDNLSRLRLIDVTDQYITQDAGSDDDTAALLEAGVNNDNSIDADLNYPIFENFSSPLVDTAPNLPRCLYKRRIGQFYVCSEYRTADGTPKVGCIVGPCWFMMIVTLTLIISISGSVLVGCSSYMSSKFRFMYSFL